MIGDIDSFLHHGVYFSLTNLQEGQIISVNFTFRDKRGNYSEWTKCIISLNETLFRLTCHDKTLSCRIDCCVVGREILLYSCWETFLVMLLISSVVVGIENMYWDDCGWISCLSTDITFDECGYLMKNVCIPVVGVVYIDWI